MRGFLIALRPHSRSLTAVAIVLTLLVPMLGPSISPERRAGLAKGFQFVRSQLPSPASDSPRQVRPVNPSLEGIQSWISSVGAAIALADIDADGLANDVCLVDPRADIVIVEPAPGTGERFAPFVLTPPAIADAAATAPMGCLAADVNEDGRGDLVVYYWGRAPVAFVRLAGTLGLANFTGVELQREERRWYSNAATFADVDGDGHPDLIVGNYFPDGARILDASATVADGMQASMSRGFNGGGIKVMLWRPARAGTPVFALQEPVLRADVARGWTLGVGAADLDGDGLPELYLANDFGPDRLLWNRSEPGRVEFKLVEGRLSLATPPSSVLGHDSFKGMGIDFGDLDGDGKLDMFVSNITSEFALHESNFAWVSRDAVGDWRDGIAPYRNGSETLGLSRSGWAWDAKIADFDNSGTPEVIQAVGFVRGSTNRWPELQELAMGNVELLSFPAAWPRFREGDDLSGSEPNRFYVRSAGDHYVDIAAELGLRETAPSRGMAVADVDGSGRLSFAVANQWGDSSFYRNTCETCGTFLALRLLLPLDGGPSGAWRGHNPIDIPTRPAIGASVAVHLPDGRVAVSQVDGGNGHSGKRSTDVHVGLGALAHATPLSVDITWRDAAGRRHARTFTLDTGWHTLLLGSND